MSGAARILITGGTGFFGKSLLAARKRKAVPEGELVILSRDPEGFLCRFPAFAGLPGVSFAAGDVRDFPFPDGEFSAVLHAATPASARLEAENPAEMRSIIVDGTKRVLDFCRSRKVPRLLLTSSGAVYGPQEPECERMAETHPCRPVTAYGQGKLEAERRRNGHCALFRFRRALSAARHPLRGRQFSARRAGKPPDCDPRGRAAAAQLSVCGRPCPLAPAAA